MRRLPRHNRAWLALSVLVIALDQLSKHWIVEALPLFQRMAVLPSINFTHIHNTGVAFSMFSRAPSAAFVLLSGAVSLYIAVWLWRHPQGQRLMAAALALILGGALGNAIDRARLGYVVDFIDFYIGNWHFATFNVADAAITIGAGLLLLDVLLAGGRETQ